MPHPHAGARRGRWAPRGRSWWIGVLFAIGSAAFFIGPFPGVVQRVGSSVDAVIFFVGSLFFTTAAALQLLDSVEAHSGRLDVWSSAVQLAGTLLFNVSTFRAMDSQISDTSYNRLVWAPDALGSVAFLLSGVLAYLAVTGGLLRRPSWSRPWWIAFVNLLGCIAFGVSAVGAYLVPSTGDVRDLAAANAGTVIGAAGFFVGAVLLLPSRSASRQAPLTRPA